MSFLSNVRFQAFSTLLGLVVNVLTLAGIVLGVVELKPGFGPLSKPGTVLTLLYVFMFLIWIVVGIWLLGIIKRRNGISSKKKIDPSSSDHQAAFICLMYIITVPMSILWILAWGELIGWPTFAPNDNSGFMLIMISLYSILGGGGISALLAMALDWLFNLDHYSKS